ncbi:MAG: hypothetical protein GX625_10780, partial [Clostridiaceae bacterium]|nr:hypothetical protein [Clostridiaceae bacterium]
MKKLKIDAMFFIILITLLCVVNIFNTNKPTVSDLENRALKTMPQISMANLTKGSYQRDFEEYYSDTFILRDDLVKISRDVNKIMSFLGPDISIVTAVEDVQLPPNIQEGEEENVPPVSTGSETDRAPVNSSPSAENTETKTPAPTPEPEKDYGDGPNVGYWMVVDGKAVQLFKFNKESFEYYAQVLNKYSEKLGDGVKIYSMIPPT